MLFLLLIGIILMTVMKVWRCNDRSAGMMSCRVVSCVSCHIIDDVKNQSLQFRSLASYIDLIRFLFG